MSQFFKFSSWALFACLLLASCGGNNPNPILDDESPGVAHPDTAGFRVITREELDPPKAAFNFELIDQNENEVSLEDFRGSVVMIGFIYTHCPEACPIVAANFLSVQKNLAEAIDQGDLTLVLITTDPARDTPDRLNRYTNALGGDWFFLTSGIDEVRQVWEEYDVYWETKDRNKEVVVFHSYKTFLIDKTGQLRFEFVGVWYPDDIEPDLLNLISE